MKIINIAISCAGSGIGQSIIDSCRLSDLPIVTFGLDNNPLAYGLYDCDYIIKTPSITSKKYIDKIIHICLINKIKIIIPGLDDEILLFSRNLEKFNKEGIEVIISGEKLLNLVRDKAITTKTLSDFADIFVKSFTNKRTFLNALDKKEISYPVIAKPRGGSASAEVHIIFDNSDLKKITNKHIIQEIARPHKNDINIDAFEKLINKKINPQVSEISIQLVASKRGDVIGKMVSFNRLKKGMPTEIIPFENLSIWGDIEKIIQPLKALGFRGPLNLQGRITDNGLKIFEINARFTGITGLRALMGFNEVEACIKSWLNLNKNDDQLQINHNVFGVRQFRNKVVQNNKNTIVSSLFSKINKADTVSNKKILITGSTGFLGRNLIDELLNQNSGYTITALVRDKENAQLILPEKIKIFNENDLDNGKFSFGSFDVLLHLGFARPHKSDADIAESLTFTGKIFRRAVETNLGNIINVSSQSVYGNKTIPPWKENTKVAPNFPYAFAKLGTEILLKELSQQHQQINATSLRLSGIVGGAKGLINIDLVSKFVEKVKNGENLKIVGGMQVFERLDLRDAVLAIIALLNTTSRRWKPIYNLGPNNPISLLDLAEEIIRIGKIYNPNNASKINFEEKDIPMKFGMDITSFVSDTGWTPKYTIQDTIHSLFNYDY